MGTRETTETADWIGQLEEIIRLTAPPASKLEILEQGLGRTAAALGVETGVILMRESPDQALAPVASLAGPPDESLLRAGEAALRQAGVSGMAAFFRDTAGRSPAVIPIAGNGGAIGAMVLDLRGSCSPVALQFAWAAAQIVSSSLRAAGAIVSGRLQGELLARRNLELEALREIGSSLQAARTEEEILQAVIDLVLEKLGLEAAWIFWGEETQGRLELAAARGVSEEFEKRARESGIGICLCLDVFTTGRLRVARNTTECPRLPELVGGSGARSHACIPLKFDRGVLGVLNVASRGGAAFSSQELEFLQTVGTQACLAVDKVRTGRAEARRYSEARALISLAEAIGGSLDQDRVLAAVGDYIRQLLGFDRCAIFLGDEGAAVSLAYLSGPPIQGFEIGRTVDLQALGSRALPGALRAQGAVVIDDAGSDPRSNAELARQWGIGSAILVPLAAHGRVSGILQASRERVAAFRPEEVALVMALAGQAAVAIENARLLRESREAFLDLQKAQEGMMRAERLAAVGTLASSLAHEVRNPLNSISLILVRLTRRLARPEASADPDLAPMVESVRREVERLDALVEEFLSRSTLDRLERRDVDPATVARDMIVLMAPLAASRGIEVRDDLGSPLPALPLDRQKLKQVLINLARNAIEAMPEGGTLAVSARQQDDGVVIEVADTGVGIEPGIDVFDFFTSTKRGGTGLGLPISRRIVEAHGGRLTYESSPGKGSAFRVFLVSRRRAGGASEAP